MHSKKVWSRDFGSILMAAMAIRLPSMNHPRHFAAATDAQYSCPAIGTSPAITRPPDVPFEMDGLFLNLETPLQCRGTVTGWRVCYYVPSRTLVGTIRIMVYRRLPSPNDDYSLVPGSVMTRQIDLETSK